MALICLLAQSRWSARQTTLRPAVLPPRRRQRSAQARPRLGDGHAGGQGSTKITRHHLSRARMASAAFSLRHRDSAGVTPSRSRAAISASNAASSAARSLPGWAGQAELPWAEVVPRIGAGGNFVYQTAIKTTGRPTTENFGQTQG